MKQKKPLAENGMLIAILSSVLSIIVGLVFGAILLLILNPAKAGIGISAMLTTGISSLDQFGKVLYQSAPLMLCGLSVGFAFKTGLFNIGASGQYTMGAFFALVGAIQFQLPWFLCLLMACIGGAIWGIFPGLFKALFNVNEVITSIMFNWICMFLVNLLSSWINISFFIAILVAILVWFILNKTTFGYELKACGLNKDASIYAGINANRNIVLSMIIAGALSGLGGGLYYLAGTIQYVMEKSILSMGFNGIPVALLANSNPIGTIFSSLFISYIQVGGSAMQPNFSSESIDIIIAVIIYLAAFSLLIRGILTKILSGNKKKEVKA